MLLLVLLKRRLPFGSTGLAPETIMRGAVLSVDQLQQCIDQQLGPLMQRPQVSRALPRSRAPFVRWPQGSWALLSAADFPRATVSGHSGTAQQLSPLLQRRK